ncbi:hypothetical protein COSO111634_29145 [Corallococcus soli]
MGGSFTGGFSGGTAVLRTGARRPSTSLSSTVSACPDTTAMPAARTSASSSPGVPYAPVRPTWSSRLPLTWASSTPASTTAPRSVSRSSQRSAASRGARTRGVTLANSASSRGRGWESAPGLSFVSRPGSNRDRARVLSVSAGTSASATCSKRLSSTRMRPTAPPVPQARTAASPSARTTLPRMRTSNTGCGPPSRMPKPGVASPAPSMRLSTTSTSAAGRPLDWPSSSPSPTTMPATTPSTDAAGTAGRAIHDSRTRRPRPESWMPTWNRPSDTALRISLPTTSTPSPATWMPTAVEPSTWFSATSTRSTGPVAPPSARSCTRIPTWKPWTRLPFTTTPDSVPSATWMPVVASPSGWSLLPVMDSVSTKRPARGKDARKRSARYGA